MNERLRLSPNSAGKTLRLQIQGHSDLKLRLRDPESDPKVHRESYYDWAENYKEKGVTPVDIPGPVFKDTIKNFVKEIITGNALKAGIAGARAAQEYLLLDAIASGKLPGGVFGYYSEKADRIKAAAERAEARDRLHGTPVMDA